MLKDLFTFIRISWYLFNNHPDKVFRRSILVDGVTFYAIYDADNNQRLTLQFPIEAWGDLSNRKINAMLQPYGT